MLTAQKPFLETLMFSPDDRRSQSTHERDYVVHAFMQIRGMECLSGGLSNLNFKWDPQNVQQGIKAN